MKDIAFTPAAEADIIDIWDYSFDKWGVIQADSYIDVIRDICQALASGTKQGSFAQVLPHVMKYLCGSHILYFLDYPDRLVVVRILLQRQDA